MFFLVSINKLITRGVTIRFYNNSVHIIFHGSGGGSRTICGSYRGILEIDTFYTSYIFICMLPSLEVVIFLWEQDRIHPCSVAIDLIHRHD